ncbi:hypothetical protein DWQ65_11070 [Treponema phagedenis]|uniref:Uncharacterized protein n=1 Tax=Treponema phagedenis TaxID=162 RepID=A0A0B7GXQ0_TREPH|nr:hypothetical protein [Treponema phagedenis]EFW38046.1 hypothetical protein HMPREF9554_01444 [Treponema phagedenis F0421]NVP25181.1 hypothetical protein [Treponema phagedenis]QEK05282.1 hypothetical protein FUT80_00095 [Treponema phagedenis]QKS93153.1 hypothetical protein HPJ96_11765 [Treponema phagedenis]QLC59134.1 hypothetical protein HW453_10265 [Treponema phagedenis]
MKVFFRLVKIYLASTFNFKNLKEQIKKKKKGQPGEKTSKLKAFGMIILFALLLVELLFFFGGAAYSLYTTAKALHNMNLLFEISAAIISVFTLLIGFMLTTSTYYIGDIEELFLSMPIKPRALFGAKFAANSVNGILTSVSFFAVLSIIYGIFEKPPFLFYVYALVCALAIPLPMIALCYFFNILIMRFTNFLKNKNLILTVNGIIGMGFAIGFNYILQSAKGTPDEILQTLASGTAALQDFGAYYPLVKFVGVALTQPVSLFGFFSLFGLLLASMVLPVCVIFFMSNMYAKSLIGFGEHRVKKLEAKHVSQYIKKKIKAAPLLYTCVKREFNMMNRTPIYLLNGPLSIIFLPILLIVIFSAKNNGLKMSSEIMQFIDTSSVFVITGLAAGILGSMTNIADTAVSRDAKFIPIIKSFPIDIKIFMYAKLIHAMIFAVFATIIIVGFAAVFFKLSILYIIFASLISLAFSAMLNLVGLFLDTAKPKLHWDNPVSAMKQNLNVMFVMFFNLIIMGIAIVVFFLSRNTYDWVLLIYFAGIPAAVFFVLLKPYGIFAENKIAKIEL